MLLLKRLNSRSLSVAGDWDVEGGHVGSVVLVGNSGKSVIVVLVFFRVFQAVRLESLDEKVEDVVVLFVSLLLEGLQKMQLCEFVDATRREEGCIPGVGQHNQFYLLLVASPLCVL